MGHLVYCVTTDGAPLVINEGDLCVYAISDGGLSVVVSDTDESRMRVSRANTLRFQRVLEQVMTQRTGILPMQFGLIAEDTEVVRRMILRDQAEAMRYWLDKVDNRCEVSLKVSWPRELLFATVVARDLALRAAQAAAQSVTAKIAVGQQIEAAIKTLHDETRTTVLSQLSPLVEATVEMPPANETVSLSTSFLVETSRLAAFEAAVEAADTHFAGQLTFKLVAPLPAYSFVDLMIKVN